jgi:hypothetical protein
MTNQHIPTLVSIGSPSVDPGVSRATRPVKVVEHPAFRARRTAAPTPRAIRFVSLRAANPPSSREVRPVAWTIATRCVAEAA